MVSRTLSTREHLAKSLKCLFFASRPIFPQLIHLFPSAKISMNHFVPERKTFRPGSADDPPSFHMPPIPVSVFSVILLPLLLTQTTPYSLSRHKHGILLTQHRRLLAQHHLPTHASSSPFTFLKCWMLGLRGREHDDLHPIYVILDQ